MRIVPRSWSLETLWCAMKGHQAPAASVRQLRPEDSALGLELEGATRLVRCLRCDGWIHVADPARPTTDHVTEPLPQPLRGKALHGLLVLRIIAVDRALHVVAFLLGAILLIALEIGLPTLRAEAQTLVDALQQTRSGHGLMVGWLNRLAGLDDGHVVFFIAFALGFAVLEGVEAFYLWRGARWAEYLTVVATSVFLPLEISELMNKVSFLRVSALVVNLAIVAYLIWSKRLFGARGGQAAAERELADDVNWPQLFAEAPVRSL